MTYETQEEFEHFEGAMEQSVPQEEFHCGKDGHALCSVNCPVHSLRKKIDTLKKNERNMGKGKYQLETVGEVLAWNYALEEVKNILS